MTLVSGADLQVFADAEAVAAATADAIGAVAATGGHLAVAGGSTPRRAYELLAERGADLSAMTCWASDDRAVPPSDERSNQRMLDEALFDRMPEPHRARVHRIEGELGAQAAADRYEALIRAELGDAPVFDLVMLGLGPDAHVASLFPGKPAVEERERLVAAVPEAGMEPYVPRVTFTLPLISAARSVLVLVTGAGKAEAVARAFGPDPDLASPAARIRPVTVLLDEAAARDLPR